jgi:hypothetical protein
MKKFVGEVLGLLVKLALFFLIVGVILGFILAVHAYADVALATSTVDISFSSQTSAADLRLTSAA